MSLNTLAQQLNMLPLTKAPAPVVSNKKSKKVVKAVESKRVSKAKQQQVKDAVLKKRFFEEKRLRTKAAMDKVIKEKSKDLLSHNVYHLASKSSDLAKTVLDKVLKRKKVQGNANSTAEGEEEEVPDWMGWKMSDLKK